MKLHRPNHVPVLLYGSETWTLLASDIKKLEAFHLRCQRQLLCVSWRDHITNEAICKQTKLASLIELVWRRRRSIFGHTARLDAVVPAHQALCLQTNISMGRNPGTCWKRLAGRPGKNGPLRFQMIPECHRARRSLGCLHSSWPWKRDATVSEDYALLMIDLTGEKLLLLLRLKLALRWRQYDASSSSLPSTTWCPLVWRRAVQQKKIERYKRGLLVLCDQLIYPQL